MTTIEAINFAEDRIGLFGGQMEEFIKISLEALKEQHSEKQGIKSDIEHLQTYKFYHDGEKMILLDDVLKVISRYA